MSVTTIWASNAQNTAQVETATVTAVAAGGVLTATINGKTISYTCTGADTTTTAAAAWFALLNQVQSTPPEFGEITWTNPSAGVVVATAGTPGTPFAGMTGGLVFSAAGGAAVTQTHTTPNSSESDVANAANWRRNGVVGLPQDNDDLVVSDSDVPLLWNLDALKNVRLNSYTRWQSMTGAIGLPRLNPLGYYEFRPTYFQFSGGSGTSSSSPSPSPSAGAGSVLNMILGVGAGNGPTRERYNVSGQQTNLTALAAGAAADSYSICFLGTNQANTLSVVGTSVGLAMVPGEVANLITATVDGGGLIALGPGCTMTGTFTATGGQALLNGCAPAVVVAQAGSQIVQTTVAANPKLTFPSVTSIGGSRLTWLSGSDITALVLQTSSVLDKSKDLRPMVIGTLTMDVDTCQVLDPNGVATITNPVLTRNALQSGPLVMGVGRTIKIG